MIRPSGHQITLLPHTFQPTVLPMWLDGGRRPCVQRTSGQLRARLVETVAHAEQRARPIGVRALRAGVSLRSRGSGFLGIISSLQAVMVIIAAVVIRCCSLFLVTNAHLTSGGICRPPCSESGDCVD